MFTISRRTRALNARALSVNVRISLYNLGLIIRTITPSEDIEILLGISNISELVKE
jgi:hypothetical protein